MLSTDPPPEPPLDLASVVRRAPIDHAHHLHKPGSTNDAALGHARRSPGEATELFVAEHQQAGRGRRGAGWWSPPGSLAFSLLTGRLDLGAERTPLVSLAVGGAIAEAVEAFLPARAWVKWPNDVYVRGRKLAGVLIEAPAAAPGRLVIGVGLNVNNRAAQAPGLLSQTAIGMLDTRPSEGVTAERLNRTEVLIACLERLDAAIGQITQDDVQASTHAWNERALLTGRRVRLRLPQRLVEGRVMGVDERGALRIDTDRGPEAFRTGSVEWFEPDPSEDASFATSLRAGPSPNTPSRRA